jgi:hypothetical protein
MKKSMSRQTAAPPAPEESNEDDAAVHAWRVTQLTRLGLASLVAEAVADRIDWHEVARLVSYGCPAALAVAIID